MSPEALIDRQLDERARLAADSHDAHEDNSINNQPRGAQVVQINHVSVPQMVALILTAMLACLSVGLWYMTTQTMQLYEREIRLAQRDAQDAKNQANTLREVLEIVGLKVPQQKRDDNEQQ